MLYIQQFMSVLFWFKYLFCNHKWPVLNLIIGMYLFRNSGGKFMLEPETSFRCDSSHQFEHVAIQWIYVAIGGHAHVLAQFRLFSATNVCCFGSQKCFLSWMGIGSSRCPLRNTQLFLLDHLLLCIVHIAYSQD